MQVVFFDQVKHLPNLIGFSHIALRLNVYALAKKIVSEDAMAPRYTYKTETEGLQERPQLLESHRLRIVQRLHEQFMLVQIRHLHKP